MALDRIGDLRKMLQGVSMPCISSSSPQKEGTKQNKNNQADIKAHESNLKKNTPETSSISLPVSHISSNKGAVLVAIRLVWLQCGCDVLLLGSYSHFQYCMGRTLGPVTA